MTFQLIPVSFAGLLFINMLIFGTLTVCAVAVTFKFLPPRYARTRYLIVLFAFAAASLVPVLASSGADTFAQVKHASRLALRDLLHAASRNDSAGTPAAPTDVKSLSGSTGLLDWTIDSNRLARNPLAIGFFWLWLVVSLILISRDLIAHGQLSWRRRKWELAPTALRQQLNWPNRIPLYLHPQIGPSAIGWLRPAVVLPRRLLSDMQPNEVSQIARHELAHARWQDPLVNALLRNICALLWPGLPLWLLQRWAYIEREAAADRAAIVDAPANVESKQDSIAYAALLVTIAEWGHKTVPNPFPGTQVGGTKALENRVYRLTGTSPRLTFVRAMFSLAALCGGVLGIGLLPVALADPTIGSGARKTPVTNHAEYRRVIFNGPNGPVIVRRTETGEVEEPILQRSEDEMRAMATTQVMPSVDQNSTSNESGSQGVQVFILVDQDGTVFFARAVAGDRDPEKERRATEAARRWTFNPATSKDKPIKVAGTLTFFGSLDQSKGWVELR